ncbi:MULTISPECIES: NAD(P)-binding protein [unclassified Halomonas]|uniref:NAD(P)-binding protein n=1 Tax=unclassified Halomonas TaxID=2609666 RepID=UPI00209D4A10|nr:MULTISPECIES: NAD(P)-binding protein [unclassified Halomonas]MCP1314518.1 NAD(P)-binding protein [Halomonas sp. 707D7]MCP1325341.1 NAD(P)-binding protein [Halomonas sp. 707D4]
MSLVIIGGGISGLFMAHMALKADPERDITVIEKADHVGGLLCGHHYPEGYYFDKGTHLFRESGIADIDSFMTHVPPESALYYLPDHGYSGCIFNGKLQENSHYPLVQNVQLRQETVQYLKNSTPDHDTSNLSTYCRSVFGPSYSDHISIPMAEAIFHKKACELSFNALSIIGQDRVLSFDQKEWRQASNTTSLVAFPDQRKIPDTLKNPRRRFYSKEKGTFSVVDGIARRLQERGVKIWMNTDIMTIDDHRIDVRHGGNNHTLEFDTLAFATSTFATANLLNIDIQTSRFDRPLEHHVIHMVLSHAPISELAFFYNLDRPDHFFRVTNYSRILNVADDTRISIEVLRNDQTPIDDKDVRTYLADLCTLGFIHPSTSIVFHRIERLASGFPMMTNKNRQALSSLATSIEKVAGTRYFLGRGETTAPFLQSEVLASIHKHFTHYL